MHKIFYVFHLLTYCFSFWFTLNILLPMMRDMLGEFFIFQHQTRDTVRLLELATSVLFHHICGHQTVPTATQSTTRYEASSSSKCISHGCTTLTDSSSVWCTFGMAWTRLSLTVQLTSGVAVLVLVYGQRVDTLNKCCNIY